MPWVGWIHFLLCVSLGASILALSTGAHFSKHPLLVASLAVFSHFLQLSSPNVTDTPFLKVRKVGPDSHCVYLRELSKFQFLLNFKLLAPSWELVNCRTFRWFLFMLMQSTDIGCKEIFFLKKKWLETMLLFQNFNVNQAWKRWCRKWQKTCKWL